MHGARFPVARMAPAASKKRAARTGPLGSLDLDETPDAPPVSEQIISALVHNAGKVLDLFRSWDNNGDGVVTRGEFHKAMKALGLQVKKSVVDGIFSRWDRGGDGQLSLSELTSILRAAATTKENIELLRKEVAGKGLKVVGIFREWDASGDGFLERDEFRQGVQHALGHIKTLPVEQIDAIVSAAST